MKKRKTVEAKGTGWRGKGRVTHTLSLSLSVADEEKEGRRERRMLEYGVSNREQGLGLSWKVGTARYNTRATSTSRDKCQLQRAR